jgi:hypothetical protein
MIDLTKLTQEQHWGVIANRLRFLSCRNPHAQDRFVR